MIQKRLQNILAAASVAISDAIENATAEAAGLSKPDTAALMMITQWPGGTVQSIANALALSQPATVRLIDRLEDSGLVERRAGIAGRGHVVALYATELGQKLCEASLKARTEVLHKLFDGIPSKDAGVIEQFAELVLKRVTTNAAQGDRVCRLCSDRECPNEKCPVWCEQMKDPIYKLRGWT